MKHKSIALAFIAAAVIAITGCDLKPSRRVSTAEANEEQILRNQSDAEKVHKAATAVPEHVLRDLCAKAWEDGAKTQALMADKGMGWYHIDIDPVTGGKRLYKPVETYPPSVIDVEGSTAKTAQEVMDSNGKPSLPKRK